MEVKILGGALQKLLLRFLFPPNNGIMEANRAESPEQ